MKLLVSIVAALLLVEWSIAQTPIPSRPQGEPDVINSA